jgi:glycosyltransferase involved in cell wall biosynthesis
VLLLAHDAAPTVAQTVQGWLGWLERRGGEWDLVVVDDGSSDGTAEAVQAIGHPKLRLVRHEQSQGEGAALRTGLASLTTPLTFYTLALPEYTPEGLEVMLTRKVSVGEEGKEGLEVDHVHLVSGCRAGEPVPGLLRGVGWVWRSFCWLVFSYDARPLPGWLGLWRHLAGLWLWWVFGIRYTDPACPYRLLRREILPRIIIQSNSSFAHVELLAKANFLGFMLAGEQVPLPVKPPPYRGDYNALYADAMKVANNPDFGPAVLQPASA